jgi:hypothetical protein
MVTIVAAIGMLGMAAVAIPSVPQAHADKGGVPNTNAGTNPTKHCAAHPTAGEPCNG